MRRGLVLAFVLAAACSDRTSATKPAGSASGAGSAMAPGYQALGTRPPNPRRKTPPPSIAASALAVGTVVPELVTVSDHTGATWSLTDALAKHLRVMLVFYRGDW